MNKKKEFTLIIERDSDGWFIGSVPQLQGCHTQAKNLDELIKRVKEAILLCLGVEKDKKNLTELVGIQKVVVWWKPRVLVEYPIYG